MDDKTFIAAYASSEAQRINKKLKDLIDDPMPSEEQKDALLEDIETTLARLKNALANISTDMFEKTRNHDRPL